MEGVTAASGFRSRLLGGEVLVGTFQKFGHHQATEVLAASGLDFAVVDGEHAPFDLATIDACALAARGGGMPLLVRVARSEADAVLSVLDLGATGVLVPHVASVEKAAAVARHARYRGGGRGLSPSTRAGAWGAQGLEEHMERSDREVVVVAQIEDCEALERLDGIASVEGIDALFVGRADLAASLGCGWRDPRLDEAARAVAAAAARAGKAAGAYVADASAAAVHREWGITMLVVGSDQGMLRGQAAATKASIERAEGIA